MDRELKGFRAVNITQCLGVINENLFKLLLIFFLIERDGAAASSGILSLAGAIFVIPFLLFSIPSGTLADKVSKQRVVITTKIGEVFTTIIGTIAFAYSSDFWLYFTLFMLAVQGAIFGPSKYSIVPELVPKEKLSKANGLLSSFTFLGIILGTSFAGPLAELTGKNFVFASLFCFGLAVVGLLFSLKIPYTKPAGTKNKWQWFFFTEVFKTYRKALKTRHLLPAIFGSAFFLFIGGYTQLNIIPYAIDALGKSEIAGSYFFLLTAVGIGLGSLIAGKVSGKNIMLSVAVKGSIGVTIVFFSLGLLPVSLAFDLFLLILLGFFGGLYLVPLDAFIQAASPKEECGQNVAANNFTAFAGVLIASWLIYFLNETLGLSPALGFAVMGLITAVVATTFAVLFRKNR